MRWFEIDEIEMILNSRKKIDSQTVNVVKCDFQNPIWFQGANTLSDVILFKAHIDVKHNFFNQEIQKNYISL